MSESEFRDPVFAGLVPDAFRESALTPDEAAWFAPLFPARRITCLRRSASSAYYKIDGERGLFAKSVSATQAARVQAGEDLARRAGATHVAHARYDWPSAVQPHLLVYDYMDGAHHPAAGDARAIGTALRAFHDSGRKAGIDTGAATHQRLEHIFAQVPARAVTAAHDFDYASVRARLYEGALPCHGDTVPGNIMMQGGAAHLIDFEEYPHSHFNPAWDIARIGERLGITAGAPVWQALADGYGRDIPMSDIMQAGIAMNIVNLCIVAIHANGNPTPAAKAEAAKFERLLKFYES